MKPSQIKALTRLTNRISTQHKEMHHDGDIVFRIQPCGAESEALVFTATNNSGLRWFETFYSYFAIIGPRGAVDKYEGNINVY